MEFSYYIDKGIESAGTVKALAEIIDVAANSITDAAHGRRGLPDKACVKLASYIGETPFSVISARNYAKAPEEEKEFWRPFVYGKAASWIAAIVLSAITGATALPREAAAGQGTQNNHSGTMCIMLNRL
ncbi:MAG: hypothetical protein EG826_15565 [Deltaproteobacteria bacterium]|nr:hypothetical protein [Deltaproteobacteria bacterium]